MYGLHQQCKDINHATEAEYLEVANDAGIGCENEFGDTVSKSKSEIANYSWKKFQ